MGLSELLECCWRGTIFTSWETWLANWGMVLFHCKHKPHAQASVWHLSSFWGLQEPSQSCGLCWVRNISLHWVLLIFLEAAPLPQKWTQNDQTPQNAWRSVRMSGHRKLGWKTSHVTPTVSQQHRLCWVLGMTESHQIVLYSREPYSM